MRFPSVRVQSVLYNMSPKNVARALEYLDNACRLAQQSDLLGNVMVAYGDCSPEPVFSSSDLDMFKQGLSHISDLEYCFFNSNIGSAAGHNRLLASAEADFIMILNPDVVTAPDVFIEMLAGLASPGVGLVEARQLPIEHPKYYDPSTGETSWASTACAMAPRQLFQDLRGFDEDNFFLYCDDVDFSWRARLAGLKVVHRSSASVYHDKRLTFSGGWISSAAEKYYSAQAGLILSYKYSREDLTESYLRHFRNSGDDALRRASASFELRKKSGRLPTQLDADHKIGEFINGAYAVHRFEAR